MKMAPVPEQQRQEPVASSSPDKSSAGSPAVPVAAVSAVSSAAAATATGAAANATLANNSSDAASSSSSSSTASSSSLSPPSATLASENSDGNQQEAAALPILNNATLVDGKQEETATLSTLNEGELRALLDEAITYKCPKDREGKSNLFKELLEEAEADESEEGRCWTVSSGGGVVGGASGSGSSRCRQLLQQQQGGGGGGGSGPGGGSSAATAAAAAAGGGRRSHGSRRDSAASSSVAEHLTHGGSLQNLAQEFGLAASLQGCCSGGLGAAGSYYSAAGRRKQSRRHTAGLPSVSARQREGGSLPSNVNATHILQGPSLANFDLAFEKKKGLSEQKSVYDWINKEKSKSLDKPSYSKKEEKEKDKKDNKLSGSCDIESESRDKRSSSRGKLGTNEMLESDNLPPEYDKQDCMVIDVDDLEASAISEQNASAALGGVSQQSHSQSHQHHQHNQGPRSLDAEDDEGTEMKVIDNRRPAQYVTRATFDIAQTTSTTSTTQVDAGIAFPVFESKSNKLDPAKTNGTEGTGVLPFPPYTTSKLVLTQGPGSHYYLFSGSCAANGNRQLGSVAKDLPSEKKSFDENGNAVQGYNGERKKSRRKNTQEANVEIYKAEKVPGHKNIDDIEYLVSFIENKDCKGKKSGKTGSGSGTGNSVKVKAASGAKSRSRDNKDSKREQVPNKLQKSNSLEEISKTKLEDLTAEKGTTSSGSSSVSDQHGSVNVALRRSKQRSTGDTSAVDSRGDRRSWGTEEGQSIYCNDTGDEYGSRRNSVKKSSGLENSNEAETEFHVVTNKKKKTKKQRRSSSGSRAQNLGASGSYLQRGRGFSNDYRTPLSPELRRKSASSMPPSDKSDSSDLDSVHSLPVTSKHASKTAASSSTNSAPQASCADIARMATLNMSSTPTLNISNLMPSINTSAWPSVSPKGAGSSSSGNSAEQTIVENKLPNDYPSLDELQLSKTARQQHNFVQQMNATSQPQSNFDKPPSPTTSASTKTAMIKFSKTTLASGYKKSVEATKEEAAISKVAKYVQDMENMQQQNQLQSQQESSRQSSSSNNSSPVVSDCAPTNPLPPKSPESLPAYSSPPSETEEAANNNDTGVKDSKNTTIRIRKQVHPAQAAAVSGGREFSYQGQQSHGVEESKKVSSPQPMEEASKPPASNPSQLQQSMEDKDVKKFTSAYNVTTAGPFEGDIVKPRIGNSVVKPIQQSRPIVENETIRVNKTDRLPKAIKDPQPVTSKDNTKMCYQPQLVNCRPDKPVEDSENKKSKHPTTVNKSEKDLKHLPEVQMAKMCTTVGSSGTAASSRPAVILLDENVIDVENSSELETSELTFGFEVNEELLQPEEEEEEEEVECPTPTVSPDVSRFSNSPPTFNRHQHPHPHHHQSHPQQPPAIPFDKHQAIQQQQHVRCPPNYPVNAYVPVHPIPPHSMLVQTMYMGCPMRFQAPYVVPHHPPPQMPLAEKCRHQQKEDFSSRFIAPDESHVQKFNHDKIVTFVGMAWDDVMRETANSMGRVQYYNGQ